MTKQECIAKVYEKLGFELDKIKDLLTDDGVLVLPSPDYKYSLKGYGNLIADKDHFVSFGISGLKLQPKSLFGIYNNNGWIKIESEDDLPKEYTDCFVYPKYRRANLQADRNSYRYCIVNNFTHYQPIQKPKPPHY